MSDGDRRGGQRAAIALLVTLAARSVGAQATPTGRRDTVYGAIVGRHETAQVWVDFASGALGEPWDDGGKRAGHQNYLNRWRACEIPASLFTARAAIRAGG